MRALPQTITHRVTNDTKTLSCRKAKGFVFVWGIDLTQGPRRDTQRRQEAKSAKGKKNITTEEHGVMRYA